MAYSYDGLLLWAYSYDGLYLRWPFPMMAYLWPINTLIGVSLRYNNNIVIIPQSEVASVGVPADSVRGLGRLPRRFRLPDPGLDLFLWAYSYGLIPVAYSYGPIPMIRCAYSYGLFLCAYSYGPLPMGLFLWTYSYRRIPMDLFLWAYSYGLLLWAYSYRPIPIDLFL